MSYEAFNECAFSLLFILGNKPYILVLYDGSEPYRQMITDPIIYEILHQILTTRALIVMTLFTPLRHAESDVCAIEIAEIFALVAAALENDHAAVHFEGDQGNKKDPHLLQYICFPRQPLFLRIMRRHMVMQFSWKRLRRPQLIQLRVETTI